MTTRADPSGNPRWQAVRVLARNPAWVDPYCPATCVVEVLESAGLRIVHEQPVMSQSQVDALMSFLASQATRSIGNDDAKGED